MVQPDVLNFWLPSFSPPALTKGWACLKCHSQWLAGDLRGPWGLASFCHYSLQLGGGTQATPGTVLPGLEQLVILTKGEAINHSVPTVRMWGKTGQSEGFQTQRKGLSQGIMWPWLTVSNI